MVGEYGPRMLSQITIDETMACETGMNPVSTSIINSWKETREAEEGNQRPPGLSFSGNVWSERFLHFMLPYR